MSLEEFVTLAEELGGVPYEVPAEKAEYCDPAALDTNTHPKEIFFCENITRDIGDRPDNGLVFHDGESVVRFKEHAAFSFAAATIGGLKINHASFHYEETLAENGKLSMMRRVFLNIDGGKGERQSFGSNLDRKFGFPDGSMGWNVSKIGEEKHLGVRIHAPRDTVPKFFWVTIQGYQEKVVKKTKTVSADDL